MAGRVVVVGGHQVIRGVVRMAVEGAPGLDLAGEASTGEEALEICRRESPDLLVLDLELPDAEGLGILATLREEGFAGRVLALTDRGGGEAVLEALRLGVTGFLGKADGLRSIGDAIRRVAAGERVIDADHEQSAVMELGRFARKAREGSKVAGTLTPREGEILALLADGLTMQQIGRRLGISPRTVETHVAKLYRKLEVRTRVQAVARAAALGLIDLR